MLRIFSLPRLEALGEFKRMRFGVIPVSMIGKSFLRHHFTFVDAGNDILQFLCLDSAIIPHQQDFMNTGGKNKEIASKLFCCIVQKSGIRQDAGAIIHPLHSGHIQCVLCSRSHWHPQHFGDRFNYRLKKLRRTLTGIRS